MEAVLHGDRPRARTVPCGCRSSATASASSGRSCPLPIDRYETGAMGVLPVMHPQIDSLQKGQPGEEGGLQKGDFILAAGEPDSLASRRRTGELSYKRPTAPSRSSRPTARERVLSRRFRRTRAVPWRSMCCGELSGSPSPSRRARSKGGCASARRLCRSNSRPSSRGRSKPLKLSVEQNWEWTTQIFDTLGGLFTRETSVKQLMGPVAIAGLSGEAAQQVSWIPLFSLMAMISLNLGLLNLMPIPVLDGGHIAILALEGVSRRDFSMKVKEKMLLAGFVLLLMLMVTVIYNDLMRIQWIERFVPWR